MSVTISRESLTDDLFPELLPLAQKCWEESTRVKAETCAFYGERDFQIEPDIGEYRRYAGLGSMVVISVRDEGRLVGYIIGLLFRAMHHRKMICGLADSIYIEPDYRSYAPVVTEKFEKELQSLGVGIIAWPTHQQGPMYEVLKLRGYVGDDIIMEKRLCVS